MCISLFTLIGYIIFNVTFLPSFTWKLGSCMCGRKYLYLTAKTLILYLMNIFSNAQ